MFPRTAAGEPDPSYFLIRPATPHSFVLLRNNDSITSLRKTCSVAKVSRVTSTDFTSTGFLYGNRRSSSAMRWAFAGLRAGALATTPTRRGQRSWAGRTHRSWRKNWRRSLWILCARGLSKNWGTSGSRCRVGGAEAVPPLAHLRRPVEPVTPYYLLLTTYRLRICVGRSHL